MTSPNSVSTASRDFGRVSQVGEAVELMYFLVFNFLGKIVKLVSFVPFRDAAHALEVANDVSEGPLYTPFALSGCARERWNRLEEMEICVYFAGLGKDIMKQLELQKDSLQEERLRVGVVNWQNVHAQVKGDGNNSGNL